MNGTERDRSEPSILDLFLDGASDDELDEYRRLHGLPGWCIGDDDETDRAPHLSCLTRRRRKSRGLSNPADEPPNDVDDWDWEDDDLL
jgi:hypothetical protein